MHVQRGRLVRFWITIVAGVALGVAGAIPVVAQLGDGDEHDLGVHHNPPLVASPGEDVTLAFGLACPYDHDRESCLPQGSVHVRGQGDTAWTAIDLEGPSGENWLLSATVPGGEWPDGFEYWAELDTGTGVTATYPEAGSESPLRVVAAPAESLVGVRLDATPSAAAGAVVWEAGWGEDVGQVGLDEGDESPRIGPSSFDVMGDGTVVVYDAVGGRLLLDGPDGRRAVDSPTRVSFVDVAATDDGSVYLLELIPGADRVLDLYRLPAGGDAFERVGAAAEAMADQLRAAGTGVVAHQYPSDVWRPVVDEAGVAVDTGEQRRAGRPGRPTRDGDEVVLKATEDLVRVAVVADGMVTGTFEVAGPARFGEAQLAETLDDGSLVLVVREITEAGARFRMLRIAPSGELLWDATAPTGDWAESAPVSRFRLDVEQRLQQLQSDPEGVRIVRYDTIK